MNARLEAAYDRLSLDLLNPPPIIKEPTMPEATPEAIQYADDLTELARLIRAGELPAPNLNYGVVVRWINKSNGGIAAANDAIDQARADGGFIQDNTADECRLVRRFGQIEYRIHINRDVGRRRSRPRRTCCTDPLGVEDDAAGDVYLSDANTQGA